MACGSGSSALGDLEQVGVTMTYMLCRNRVSDYSNWKAVFDSNAEAGRDAGLQLVNLWRSVDDPNNVFFMFEIANIDSARAFISNPAAEEAGKASGVVDGECHFVESAPGY